MATPITDPQKLREAAENSTSISGVLRYLGLSISGAQARRAVQAAEKFGITLPKGGRPKGYIHPKTRNPTSNEEWFVENVLRHNADTKKRMLAMGIENECKVCGLENSWNGLPLSLQLDHIDGDRTNNLLSNLRFICPNCHTQTNTYAGKKTDRVQPLCLHCGTTVSIRARLCSQCFLTEHNSKPRAKNIIWPELDELLSELKESPVTEVAKSLGVSDNAVRKHLKRNGMPTSRKDLRESG